MSLCLYILSVQGGPSARSCHKVCFDSKRRHIYVLGRFIESSERHHTELKVLVCRILKSIECSLAIINIYWCIVMTICNTFLIFVQVSKINLLLASVKYEKLRLNQRTRIKGTLQAPKDLEYTGCKTQELHRKTSH